MNKIATMYVEAYGDFDVPYPVTMFAGRADQMEEVCRRLNKNMLMPCPDVRIEDHLNKDGVRESITQDLMKSALLSQDSVEKLLNKIVELSGQHVIYAESGAFAYQIFETL